MSLIITIFQANIVCEDVTIPPKYYNSLIGSGGKLIRAIMDECGGVTIKFPSVESKSDKVSIYNSQELVDLADVCIQILLRN